jgi:hypothetical protein
MGAFSDRFDSDERCRQCHVKGTCRIKIQALEREHRRPSTPTTTYTPSSTSPAYRPSSKGKVYEEPSTQDTFTGVLAYNAGLNAITTMSETLTEALAGIPRKKYPSLRRRSTE